ncbi:MAG: CBS domain-containing protein [Euryarchaeota archaeon]|nr:CBS domain-containing protein [Euryarchaeota archaeon]
MLISEKITNDIIKRYLNGESPRLIAKDIGVHYQTVYYHLKRTDAIGQRKEFWKKKAEELEDKLVKLGEKNLGLLFKSMSKFVKPVQSSLNPNDTIQDALRIMLQGIRRIPVLKDKKVVGTLTSIDIIRNLTDLITGDKVKEVQHYMTEPVIISSDKNLIEAAKLMCEKNVSGLWVINKHGKLIGSISQTDLVCAIADLMR